MAQASGTAHRISAIDWLRGLAVVVMIQCHALVLLAPALKASLFFRRLDKLDGLVAPSFLLAAGFSLALVQVRGANAGTRLKRFWKTSRRLGEVLLVASLVNWMWFPVFREPLWLLRVDILQCIGFSLLLALPVTAGLATRPWLLCLSALGLGALAFGLAPLAENLAGPLARFANHTTGSVFPLLPWAGYVYLGAAAGAAAGRWGRPATWFAGLGAVGAAAWLAKPLFLRAYPPHDFWVTDPANHGERLLYVCLAALALLGLERGVKAEWRTSAPARFLETFGTSSLAAYFFHQALLFSRPFGVSVETTWGGQFGWAAYWVATLAVLAATFGLTRLSDFGYRAAGQWWDGRSKSLPRREPA